MNNSNNNNWITENPLFQTKNQRYYYDFGTGKQIEKEEVKEKREAFLKAVNGSSTNPQEQKKDDFLEGFNDPYGEKREQERNERFSNIRANADKRTWPSQRITDSFLNGFNGASKEESVWERAFGSVKLAATDALKKTKEKSEEFINDASSWANEKGILDDVTNTFFKAYDFSQDFLKLLPTDTAHHLLANVNHKGNQAIDLSSYAEDGGYINNQNVKNSQAGKIQYGSGTFGSNGCEIIAVNNALVSLGNRKDIRDIAKDFEMDGQVLFGALGTNPYAIDDYFKKQGYQVETFTGDDKIENLDIPDADTYIVSFWNSDKAIDAIHTVSFDKLPNGKYRIYNENGRKVLDVTSPKAYFEEKKRIPLVLHCIKKG